MRYLFFLLIFPALIFTSPKKIVAAAYKNKMVKKPVIILDAGHGGQDIGTKIKYPFCEEKRLCLTTTLYAKRYLEQMGYHVVLTRAKDYAISLQKRVDITNQSKSNLFVSIHFNSCPSKDPNGIEIFYFNSKNDKKRAKLSKSLATDILYSVIGKTKAKNRGVKSADFFVIRDTQVPAILLEGGFLTNAYERDNLRKNVYLEKIAIGVANGVDKFIKHLP
ncbi:MAG: N-acetylmuramoyl-L-alanine amidase LytC [Candidatus Anoxychlamydiales bacterium]|nr:N-acetylmuramoyl-L-alanine amidase LytC [Candidatus Anoxychlamydiales bacterium]